MDTSSQRVAAFHGCRSAVEGDLVRVDGWFSSDAGTPRGAALGSRTRGKAGAPCPAFRAQQGPETSGTKYLATIRAGPGSFELRGRRGFPEAHRRARRPALLAQRPRQSEVREDTGVGEPGKRGYPVPLECEDDQRGRSRDLGLCGRPV